MFELFDEWCFRILLVKCDLLVWINVVMICYGCREFDESCELFFCWVLDFKIPYKGYTYSVWIISFGMSSNDIFSSGSSFIDIAILINQKMIANIPSSSRLGMKQIHILEVFDDAICFDFFWITSGVMYDDCFFGFSVLLWSDKPLFLKFGFNCVYEEIFRIFFF